MLWGSSKCPAGSPHWDPNEFAGHALWLLLLTGVRRSEILAAKWSDVHWDNGTLYIGETKKGDRVLTHDQTTTGRSNLPKDLYELVWSERRQHWRSDSAYQMLGSQRSAVGRTFPHHRGLLGEDCCWRLYPATGLAGASGPWFQAIMFRINRDHRSDA